MSSLQFDVWICPVCDAQTPNSEYIDDCWGTKWVTLHDGTRKRSEESCNYNRKYGLLSPKGRILLK